ncbi:MAG: hypothetical protein CFE21_17145 [Bacteroidetes bacterium B1(2017)]|nr:MAG: hypothetical protein CFE21_17145 [Bacteroidetes bacterium B1(2017)]
MKKIYLLLFALASTFAAFAQCIPDPTLTKPGLKPSKLPNGIAGTPYSEVATLVVPKDTFVNYNGTVYNVVVDSASVVGMSDLPKGFSYQCDKPSKTWAGGQRGCARLYGNPTLDDTGDYVIYVKVRTYFKIVGLPNQLDQLDSSTIDFKIVKPTGMQELVQAVGLKAYPNPAGNLLTVEIKKYSATATYQIYNVTGQVYDIPAQMSPNTGEVKFDVSSLKPGVYFVKGVNEGLSYQAKFVKE